MKQINFPLIINRSLLAGIVVAPIIFACTMFYLADMTKQSSYLLTCFIVAGAVMSGFLCFYLWGWFSTEGAGPVE